MLQFRQVTIYFDSSVGRKQREPGAAVFGGRVRSAEAMLKGFSVGYTNSDRELYRFEVDLDITSIQNNVVRIAADYLLRDRSGYIDDPYDGWVQAVVVADVV